MPKYLGWLNSEFMIINELQNRIRQSGDHHLYWCIPDPFLLLEASVWATRASGGPEGVIPFRDPDDPDRDHVQDPTSPLPVRLRGQSGDTSFPGGIHDAQLLCHMATAMGLAKQLVLLRLKLKHDRSVLARIARSWGRS